MCLQTSIVWIVVITVFSAVDFEYKLTWPINAYYTGLPAVSSDRYIDLYFKTLDSADRRFDMDESTRKPLK